MDTSNSERLWVRWTTRDETAISRIRQRFGMPRYTTLNGLTPCEVSGEDMALLEETARRGFLTIMRDGWSKNGDTFSFISRQK